MRPEFDRYSGEYDALLHDPVRERFAPGSAFFHERKWLLLQQVLRAHHRSPERMSWLDIGCGRGELLRVGQPHFESAAGCDFSAGMLAQCSGLNVRVQESSERLPFDDAQFDLATAVCVFHHVPRAERVALAREAIRVLKPGGWFCIIEHNPWNPMTQFIVRRSPVDVDAQLLTAHTARNILRGAGAQVFDTQYFLYFPEKVYRQAARVEEMLRHVPAGGQYAVFGSTGGNTAPL